MHLYCGDRHPLFHVADSEISREQIPAEKYAGLGYHSPNMAQGRELGMSRAATAYDQEGIATLLLSGRYVVYLPDHYARIIVEAGQLRMIGKEVFHYCCDFSAILRNSPRPGRIVATFLQQLLAAHPDIKH